MRFSNVLVVGLGALTLSCAAMRNAGLPGLEAARTAVRAAVDTSKCDGLNTDISFQEEYALGGAVAVNWVQQGGGLIPATKAHDRLHRHLNIVGRNLAAQSPRPTLRWTFGVLQNPADFNAVSAPGGYIFVTQKLLEGMDNEAQLAGVLAHEIAHITLMHALTRYGEAKVSQCKTAVRVKAGEQALESIVGLSPKVLDSWIAFLDGKSGGVLDLDKNVPVLGSLTDTLVEALASKGLGPEDEFAADELAVRLLVSAGYDPREYLRVLEKIPDSQADFANHPSKEERVERLEVLLANGREASEDFTELAADPAGLAKPALPPEYASLKGKTASR